MADPSFDAVYVSTGYGASVTVPGGLSASHLVAFVAAFGDATSSITMSGWTQQAIAGASGGGKTVRQAVFTRAYAAGTYSATLGGALSDYEMTIYAVNDVGSIGATASDVANNENPASFSASPAITNNNSLVIGCITCWGDCPKSSDITGTWTSTLGPPTLPSPNDSEQRTWYNSQNSGTASFAVTKTFTNPDAGVASVIVIEAASAGSTVDLESAASFSATATGGLALSSSLTSGGSLSLSGAAPLALAANLSSDVTASVAASGNAALTANLASSGSVSISGSGGLTTGALKIFVMSNSLGAGTWNGGVSTYALTGVNGLSSLRPDADYVYYASNGATTASLISGYSANILPFFDPSARNIILFWEGVNSLLVPTTPAAEIAQLESFAATAQGDGFEVIVGTLLPIGFPGEDVAASALNVLLRASTAFDGLIDLRMGLPQFSPVSGNPLYDTDYDAHLSDGATGGYAVSTGYWDDSIGWYLEGTELASGAALGVVATGGLLLSTELTSGGSLALSGAAPLSLAASLSAEATASVVASGNATLAADLASSGSAGVSGTGGLELSSELAASVALAVTSSADATTATTADLASNAQLDLSASASAIVSVDLASEASAVLSAAASSDLTSDLGAAASALLFGTPGLTTTIDFGSTETLGLVAAGDLVVVESSDLAANQAMSFGLIGELGLTADMSTACVMSLVASGSLAETVPRNVLYSLDTSLGRYVFSPVT